ncbi:MAG: CPBP family intramembrane metalloprotease [Clostridia bacterium]|nr:CPBP family intramembrane metalloprotease [Clostridia bacterium]
MDSSKINDGYRSAFLSVLLQIGVMFGVSIIISTIIGAYATAVSGAVDPVQLSDRITSVTNEYVMVINAITYLLADSIPVLVFMKVSKNKGKIRNWFGKSKMSAGLVSLLCFTTIAIAFLDSIIITIYNSIFGSSGVTEQIGVSLTTDNTAVFVISILYICVVGPFLEELLFRGFILHETACVSPVFGIVISATLFGLFHMNFEQAINGAILGILFGYIALKANSIVPTVILHIFNNTFSCVLTIVSEKYGLSDTANNVLTVAVLIFGIIGFVILIAKKGKLRRNEDMIDSDIFVTDETLDEIKSKENKNNLTTGIVFKRAYFYVTYIILIAICILIQFQ